MLRIFSTLSYWLFLGYLSGENSKLLGTISLSCWSLKKYQTREFIYFQIQKTAFTPLKEKETHRVLFLEGELICSIFRLSELISTYSSDLSLSYIKISTKIKMLILESLELAKLSNSQKCILSHSPFHHLFLWLRDDHDQVGWIYQKKGN